MDHRTDWYTSGLEDRYEVCQSLRGNNHANTIAHHLGEGYELPSSVYTGHIQNSEGQESRVEPSQEGV